MTFSAIPWTNLDKAKSADALRTLAKDGTQEQLILMHARLSDRVEELVRMRKIARKVAIWVVTQGKASWFSVLMKKAVAPEKLPKNAWDALEVIEDVYRERFGDEIPPMEPRPVGARVYDEKWEPMFWEVMDTLTAGVPFDEAVARFTRSELERLSAVAAEVVNRLDVYAEKHWPDPTGAGWTYWASWVPRLGKETYDAIMSGSRDVPRELPPDAPVVQDELDEEYERRYGERIQR